MGLQQSARNADRRPGANHRVPRRHESTTRNLDTRIIFAGVEHRFKKFVVQSHPAVLVGGMEVAAADVIDASALCHVLSQKEVVSMGPASPRDFRVGLGVLSRSGLGEWTDARHLVTIRTPERTPEGLARMQPLVGNRRMGDSRERSGGSLRARGGRRRWPARSVRMEIGRRGPCCRCGAGSGRKAGRFMARGMMSALGVPARRIEGPLEKRHESGLPQLSSSDQR